MAGDIVSFTPVRPYDSSHSIGKPNELLMLTDSICSQISGLQVECNMRRPADLVNHIPLTKYLKIIGLSVVAIRESLETCRMKVYEIASCSSCDVEDLAYRSHHAMLPSCLGVRSQSMVAHFPAASFST